MLSAVKYWLTDVDKNGYKGLSQRKIIKGGSECLQGVWCDNEKEIESSDVLSAVKFWLVMLAKKDTRDLTRGKENKTGLTVLKMFDVNKKETESDDVLSAVKDWVTGAKDKGNRETAHGSRDRPRRKGK